MPDFLYHELYNWAHENGISYQQLMYELLRDGIERRRDKKCSHESTARKFSRKGKQWYCSACFTFFDKVADRAIKGGFRDVPRLPVWELKKEMSAAEWAKMTEPQNDDMK